MAYTALRSLSQVLDQSFIHHVNQFPLHLIKPKFVLLRWQVTTILTILKEYQFSKVFDLLESRIIDAVYDAEDLIEYTISAQSLWGLENLTHASSSMSQPDVDSHVSSSISDSSMSEPDVDSHVSSSISDSSMSEPDVDSHVSGSISDSSMSESDVDSHASSLMFEPVHQRNKFLSLQKVLEEIHFLSDEVMKIRNNHPVQAEPLPQQFPDVLVGLSTLTLDESETAVVGLDDDLKALQDRIFSLSSQFEVVPIVGMGGMGKSTLARKLYKEATQGKHFDRCAWIVVSQEYSRRDLLLGLLQSLTKEANKQDAKSDDDLEVCIHKEQVGRRCLIVADDLWSMDALDVLIRFFNKDPSNGSRVLLTTRLLNVANHAAASSSSSPHRMQFLSENQSWELLQKRVFGKGSCPSELEDLGMKIAKNCHGLPLTVVVIAGLLERNHREEYWGSLSENISSAHHAIEENCSKVLSLSFDNLPLHLKPCFLYVTTFREDTEINANRLIRLWLAEGFIEPNASACLEDVAEGYLEDLVGRSLLQISRKRYNGRIKAVTIHDLLRDFGILKSQEQRFHSGERFCRENLLQRKPRRLSIQVGVSMSHLQEIDLPTNRSLFYTGTGEEDKVESLIRNFPLLRVLEAPRRSISPLEIKSHQLRYLFFCVSFKNNCILPKSLLMLRNLQTIIVFDCFQAPLEILKMPFLRHLIISLGCYFEKGRQSYWGQADYKAKNLQTLSFVGNWEVITRETTEVLVNLKKLGHYFDDSEAVSQCLVKDIVHLNKLEVLKIEFSYTTDLNDSRLLKLLTFPPSLKRLTLDSTHVVWEDMGIVGSLPNLEVLKLRYEATRKGEWYPIEGEFQELKYLELCGLPLQHWEAEGSHFPSLEILALRFMLN